MKTKLYAILNTNAKNWWYHAQLRRDGKHEEARRQERAQIRDDIARLRAALEHGGFLINSWGDWTLHYGKRQRLQSWRSGLDGPIPQACLLLGIPVLDLTTIPEDRIRAVLSIPMANPCPNPEPEEGYGPFDHAPFEYVARRYVALGATVYNANIRSE